MQIALPNISRPNAFRLYFLASALSAIVGLLLLLNIPADPKNAWLLGFSKSRVAMLGTLLTMMAIFAGLGWLFGAREHWVERVTNVLDRVIYSYKMFWYIVASLLLGLVAGYFAFQLPSIIEDTTILAWLTRLSPFIVVFILLLAFTLALLAVLGYFAGVIDAGKQKAGSKQGYLETVFRAGIRNVFLLIGLGLFTLNFYGQTISLRNPQIYELLSHTISLTPEQVFADQNQRFGESNEDYFVRLTETVNQGVAHYWEDDGVDFYNMRVPAHENFILYFASLINPKRYLAYEFCNYQRAIERGVGLCSQYSLILTDILNEQGFNTRIVELDGHVAATAQVNAATDEWWVLDGDNGIAFDHDISVIQANPEMIRPYFYAAGHSEQFTDYFVDVYGVEGNEIDVNGGNDFDGGGKCTREEGFYALKWVLPMLFIAPFVVAHFPKKKIKFKLK